MNKKKKKQDFYEDVKEMNKEYEGKVEIEGKTENEGSGECLNNIEGVATFQLYSSKNSAHIVSNVYKHLKATKQWKNKNK